MGSALHVPWTANASRAATWEITAGTPDPRLVASHLGNGNPSLGCRILSLQGAMRAAHASGVAVLAVGLIHHSLDAGIDVRFEGSDDPAFGSTDVSEAITIGARSVDGYRNDWLDIYDALSGTVPSNLYHRIVADSEDNSVNLAVGEIVLATTRQLVDWLGADGAKLSDVTEANELKTYTGGSLRHPRDFRIERFGGTVRTTDADLVTIRNWFLASAGRARPVMLVPDHASDAVYFGLLSAALDRRKVYPNTNDLDWTFEELSRGLTWQAVEEAVA